MSTQISSARYTGLCGAITYLTGRTLSFTGDRAVSFSRSQGVQDGMLLGAALSSSFQLVLDDADGFFTFPHTPYGAQVKVYLTDNDAETPVGVFTVSQSARAESTGRLTLSGMDAMGSAFEAEWIDDLYYPMTLGALAQEIVGRVGFTCEDALPGQTQVVCTTPEWGDITVRRALSFVLQATGCFAMIDGAGALRFLPVWPDEETYTVTAGCTFRRTLGDGAFGPLQGISVMPFGSRRDTPPMIVQETGAALSGQNCLYLSGNPLLLPESTLLQNLFGAVHGLKLTRAQVHWAGDPALKLGARFLTEGPDGAELSTQVTRQSLLFDQGFSMQSDCTVVRSVGSVGRLVTASGALNAAMLQWEVDGRNLMADTVAASALIAGSITAVQLAASCVTADKLAASSVTAGKLAAEAVTTEKLDTGAVTTEKLAASSVTAGKLAADVGEMMDAHIESATIHSAQIDDLDATVAGITDAHIAVADIGFAQIVDAVAQNLITKDAIADNYYIRKLRVDNLQTISLGVNNLVVKAVDGYYYALTVDDNGAVTAERTDVSASEISAGVTTDGKRSIIETDLLVSELSATNIKGANALLDKLTARRISVDALFAREGFIAKLNAADISGNTFLRLMVDDKIEDMTVGGRNYLRNSGDLDFSGYYIQYLSGDPATGVAITDVTRLTSLDYDRTSPYIGYGEIDYAELED